MSIAQSRIFLAKSAVQLQPSEILIVVKDAQIQLEEAVEVHVRDIIRRSFVACTDLECAVVNMKNIKK